MAKATNNGSSTKPRVRSEFPKFSLEQALRVAGALDKNGGQPLPPIDTATGMGLSPGSSDFRALLSASIKYGLTKGTEKAAQIVMEPLGQAIIQPTTPEERARSLTEAALKPSTFRSIFDFYKGKKFPESIFFINTIVREFAVPQEHAARCEEIFRANMEFVGLFRDTPGGRWLAGDSGEPLATGAPAVIEQELGLVGEAEAVDDVLRGDVSVAEAATVAADLKTNRKVFITHGKNKKIVDQLKELLTFGDFEPVVSVERESVSKPVPDKVLDDMRSCAAAVIHVGTDQKLLDQEGREQRVINQNVLIEIGAAMMRYGRNFILLVEEGTTLPSNLQGLYEVRYSGDELDYPSTMKLLKAFNDFKK